MARDRLLDLAAAAAITLREVGEDVIAGGFTCSDVEARRRAARSARERMRRRWGQVLKRAARLATFADAREDETARAFDWPRGGMAATRPRSRPPTFPPRGGPVDAPATMPTDEPAGGREEGDDG